MSERDTLGSVSILTGLRFKLRSLGVALLQLPLSSSDRVTVSVEVDIEMKQPKRPSYAVLGVSVDHKCPEARMKDKWECMQLVKPTSREHRTHETS